MADTATPMLGVEHGAAGYVEVPQSPTHTNVVEPSETPREPNVQLSFNCGTGDYRKFIKELRENLAGHRKVVYHTEDGRTCKLLPKRTLTKPTRWMEITLESGKNKAILFIRDDDVYLKGFKGSNELYEFGFSDRTRKIAPLLPGSTFLGCGESYPKLFGEHQMDSVRLHLEMSQLQLGQEFAVEAVRMLSTYDQSAGPINSETKKALVGLIVMICESARMDPHHDLVRKVWGHKQGKAITGNQVAYLWNWGNMSRFLIGSTPHPTENLRNIGISDKDGSAEIVRLVLHPKVSAGQDQNQQQQAPPSKGPGDQPKQQPPAPPSGGPGGQPGQQPPTPPSMNNGKAPQQGQPSRQPPPSSSSNGGRSRRSLVQVYSVFVNFLNIGTIAVFDGHRGQIIYEGDHGQTGQDGYRNLVLTGPYRAISAEDRSFAITLDQPKDDADEPKDDADDETLWELKCSADNSALLPVITSKLTTNVNDQALLVTYAVLSDAVEATVDVEIELEMKGEADTMEIYGDITARMCFHQPNETIMLFKRERSKKIEPVTSGSTISVPLDRSVIVVPLGSESVSEPLVVINTKLHFSWSNSETIISFDFEDEKPLFLPEEREGEIDRYRVVLAMKNIPPLPNTHAVQEHSDTTPPLRPTGSYHEHATTWVPDYTEK